MGPRRGAGKGRHTPQGRPWAPRGGGSVRAAGLVSRLCGRMDGRVRVLIAATYVVGASDAGLGGSWPITSFVPPRAAAAAPAAGAVLQDMS